MARLARPLNSWDVVKIIGMLLMFIDHSGAYFLTNMEWMRAVGRGSAPIFLFLAGYAASYKFSRELLVLGLLMSLSNVIMGEYTSPLNILFSIMLCRAVFDWLEKHKKRIEKPFEWFVCCVIFVFITSFLFQYGTLALMFAIGGYMKARPNDYPKRTQQLFMVMTFVIYGITYALLFSLSPLSILIMAVTLLTVQQMLWRMDVHEVSGLPAWLAKGLKLASRYSAHIYAFHLIAISWISHYPI